ncbi:MAG: M13 family metallopeptidase [Nonlabens sp.]
MNKSFIYALLSLIVVTTSCKDEQEPETQVEKSNPGLDLGYMDTTVEPSNDFYRYVNGRWLDSVQIPEDETVWGGFNKLAKDTNKDVLAILEKAQDDKNLDPESDQAKAVYVFQSIMDTTARDQVGYKPLEKYLSQIEAVDSMDELQPLLVNLSQKGVNGFFSFYVGADAMDTDKNVANLGNGSLGMSREYYVADDKDSQEKLAKYKKHVERMFTLIGKDPETASTYADQVVALETKMARPRLDKVERRNPEKTYNPMKVSELQELMPQVDWKAYFKNLGAKDFDQIIVSQPQYVKALSGMWNKSNLEAMKTYLKWTVLDGAASSLSTELEDANWDFYSKTMRGAKQQRPRDERALGTVNAVVGEALGKLYVAEKFPPEAKEKALEMIDYVKKAYENRINNLEWMSADTKEKAITKLNGMTIKIGYPDEWKDYSEMEIKSPENGGNLFDNMMAVEEWAYQDNLSKLDTPVDKSEWFMPPQQVNAYYNPYYNEIVFPAAILQPPFYNYEADPAINFGGMGAVIGHEISHGFDDSGAKFDAEGNMTDWWTAEDKEKFEALGNELATQFDAIEVMPGVNINGSFTLGENIGDLGGVNAAYDALQLWLEDKKNPGEIDGYTQNQRFFMSWATVWRTKMREEALMQRIKNDTHSPGMYRGYAPLLNIPAFYEAFDIKEQDSMYIAPEKRVAIW